jgi:hypothetical protein
MQAISGLENLLVSIQRPFGTMTMFQPPAIYQPPVGELAFFVMRIKFNQTVIFDHIQIRLTAVANLI